MERLWLAEIHATCVKTVLVKAASRKEAEAKLRDNSAPNEDFEGLDVKYTERGPGRIIRELKER